MHTTKVAMSNTSTRWLIIQCGGCNLGRLARGVHTYILKRGVYTNVKEADAYTRGGKAYT